MTCSQCASPSPDHSVPLDPYPSFPTFPQSKTRGCAFPSNGRFRSVIPPVSSVQSPFCYLFFQSDQLLHGQTADCGPAVVSTSFPLVLTSLSEKHLGPPPAVAAFCILSFVSALLFVVFYLFAILFTRMTKMGPTSSSSSLPPPLAVAPLSAAPSMSASPASPATASSSRQSTNTILPPATFSLPAKNQPTFTSSSFASSSFSSPFSSSFSLSSSSAHTSPPSTSSKASTRLQHIADHIMAPPSVAVTSFPAEAVPQAPEDPLFGLMAAYRADTSPDKVDLVSRLAQRRLFCTLFAVPFESQLEERARKKLAFLRVLPTNTNSIGNWCLP